MSSHLSEHPITTTRAKALVLLAALITGAGGLAFGVSITAASPTMGMPTESTVPLVGIPAARLIGNTAGIAAAGLALLLLLLPRADAGGVDRVRSFARQTVSWIGPVWTVAVLATLWLQAAELSSNGIQASLGDIASYALNITSGRALLVAAIAAICYSFARPTIVLVLAIGGLIAVPLTGHASQEDAPILTMAAIGLHVAAAALWVGGLGAIFLLASAWPELLAVVLPRFSTVAACCIGVVAVSGVIVAVAHLTMTTGLTSTGLLGNLTGTGYGLLVIGKTTCCAALAGTGGYIRKRLLPGIARLRPVPLTGWVGAELAIMTLALGLATALARAPM